MDGDVSTGNDCDTGCIPDVCDVERIASDEVQRRQIPARTVERGTQSELNPVDSITNQGSAKGLQKVPMNAVRRRRACMNCVQRDGR